MQYKGKEITNELLEKAKQCTDVQALLKLAAENGVELSAEEAEAFLDETLDIELNEEDLDAAAGGTKHYKNMKNKCTDHNVYG